MKWVKLKKYCEDTGDTTNAVLCKLGPDVNLWVNFAEVEKWVANGSQTTLQKFQQGERVAHENIKY